MSGFDGKGPQGFGPMTGGGRGKCAMPRTFSGEDFANTAFFYGRGFGRGYGYRNRYLATGVPGWARTSEGMRGVVTGGVHGLSREDSLAMLKDHAQQLKAEFDRIQQRIIDLETVQGK